MKESLNEKGTEKHGIFVVNFMIRGVLCDQCSGHKGHKDDTTDTKKKRKPLCALRVRLLCVLCGYFLPLGGNRRERRVFSQGMQRAW